MAAVNLPVGVRGGGKSNDRPGESQGGPSGALGDQLLTQARAGGMRLSLQLRFIHGALLNPIGQPPGSW